MSDSDYTWQCTLQRDVECTGIGLHTGALVTIRLRPAPPGSGLVFVRTDIGTGLEIPADIDHVVASNLATTIGKGNVSVSTVEHLLAAFSGMGIDNARIEVDGPEVPILDGSAAPFVFLIKEAGIRTQRARRRFLLITRQLATRLSGKAAAFFPANEFKISYRVDFEHPMVSDQRLSMTLSTRAFQRDISRARTFGFLRDVEALKERGLALGGSLDNAIVLDDFRVLNTDGLRYQDEFVRHKILDAVGDLSLVGMPVIGHLAAVRSGHDLNHRLVRKLLATPDAYRIVEPSEEELPRAVATPAPSWAWAEQELAP